MNIEKTKTNKVELGNHIRIFDDDKEGTKPIWLVIGRKDDRLLLLSDNVDAQGIFADRDDSPDKISDYSDSKARIHACHFYDNTFDKYTKAHILADEDTGDMCHILSASEFNFYIGRVDFGKYINHGAKVVNWWLQDLADMKGDILYVNSLGKIDNDGMMPENGTLYYRFAIWVDLYLDVERINSPFKIEKPTDGTSFKFPPAVRYTFPNIDMYKILRGTVICYKKQDYLVREFVGVKNVDGKKTLKIRCLDLIRFINEVIEVSEDDEVYMPDFRREKYIYVGDDATRSFFMPVNGMGLYKISKEHRDMLLGKCPPKTYVNLCFFGDNVVAMEIFKEGEGFFRLI